LPWSKYSFFRADLLLHLISNRFGLILPRSWSQISSNTWLKSLLIRSESRLDCLNTAFALTIYLIWAWADIV
jgi:hypothetical protein